MARWYRSGRYYGRNRGYYGRRRYYNKKSLSSRAFGNMKAAKQQADQTNFTVNIPSQISVFCKHDNTLNADTGVYAMNCFDLLRKSDFFNNYANMYDEFKIDKVKIKLLPTQFVTNSSTGNYWYKNLTVYTAWDRSGLNFSQLQFSISNPNQIDRVDTLRYKLGNENGGGVWCTIGQDITSYSSAESRTVNPNTNTSIVRWLSPKTIQEKSQWLSTGMLKEWYTNYDSNTGRYYGIPCSNIVGENTGETVSAFNEIIDSSGQTGSIAGILDQFQSTLSSENPCSLYEDPGIKFKPTLLVGVYPLDNNDVNLGTQHDPIMVPANKITFNVETEVVCTFRGLRKSKVVAA